MLEGGEQGKEWGGRGAGWGGLLLGNTDWSMGGERGKVEEVEVEVGFGAGAGAGAAFGVTRRMICEGKG